MIATVWANKNVANCRRATRIAKKRQNVANRFCFLFIKIQGKKKAVFQPPENY
jgi:hypothetical protein